MEQVIYVCVQIRHLWAQSAPPLRKRTRSLSFCRTILACVRDYALLLGGQTWMTLLDRPTPKVALFARVSPVRQVC